MCGLMFGGYAQSGGWPLHYSWDQTSVLYHHAPQVTSRISVLIFFGAESDFWRKIRRIISYDSRQCSKCNWHDLLAVRAVYLGIASAGRKTEEGASDAHAPATLAAYEILQGVFKKLLWLDINLVWNSNQITPITQNLALIEYIIIKNLDLTHFLTYFNMISKHRSSIL